MTIETLTEFIFTISNPKIMFTISPKDVIFPQNLRHRCRGDNSPSCYDFKRSNITGRGDRFFNEFFSPSRLTILLVDWFYPRRGEKFIKKLVSPSCYVRTIEIVTGRAIVSPTTMPKVLGKYHIFWNYSEHNSRLIYGEYKFRWGFNCQYKVVSLLHLFHWHPVSYTHLTLPTIA